MLSIFKRTKKHAPKSTRQQLPRLPEMFDRTTGRPNFPSYSAYVLECERITGKR